MSIISVLVSPLGSLGRIMCGMGRNDCGKVVWVIPESRLFLVALFFRWYAMYVPRGCAWRQTWFCSRILPPAHCRSLILNQLSKLTGYN